MAQLKDTVVSGSLRATDTIYTGTVQLDKLFTITGGSGTAYSAGTNGQVLAVNSNNIAYWKSLTASDVSGTVTISHGGTGTSTAPTQGGVIYASSTSAYASTSAGTSGQFLKSNGTSAPSWASLSEANRTTAGIVTAQGTTQYFGGNKVFCGYLYRRACTINGDATQYPGDTWLQNNAGTVVAEYWYDCGDPTNITYGKYSWRQYSYKTTPDTTTTGKYETFSLPAVTAGLTDNASYNILTTKSLITIAQGGTGTGTAPTKGGVIYASSTSAYASTAAGTSGQFLKSNGANAPTWSDLNIADIKPLVTKHYDSTSFYATTSGDSATATFFFMSVKPNSWDIPWRVRFKAHTTCHSYSDRQSITYCTLSGRRDGVVFANWNENVNAAHYYIGVMILKQAGFNAGLGHAVGIDIRNGNNYTNSAYYRTFDIDYYDCENCTITLLDTPVLRDQWTNYNTTNYNGISEYDAVSRGLQESGDVNTREALYINYPRVSTGSTGIGRYTLFMEAYDGTYQSITSTFNNQGTSHVINTVRFNPKNVFYSNRSSDIAANNTGDGSNSWMYSQTDLIDLRWSLNCGTTLTARTPIYLVGTIDNDGLFTLDSSSTTSYYTQTIPTTENGKIYIYLGMVYNDGSPYRTCLEEKNQLYWYKNGAFRLYTGNVIGNAGHSLIVNSSGIKIQTGNTPIANPVTLTATSTGGWLWS